MTMDLRDELCPQTPDPERIDELASLCEAIIDCVVAGRDCGDLIERFNAATGRHFGKVTFRAIHGSQPVPEFIRRILDTQVPDELPEFSEAEAIEMVRRIRDGECTERQTDHWLRLLSQRYDQPQMTDLIFWPIREMTPDQIVQAARTVRDDDFQQLLDPLARRQPRPPDPIKPALPDVYDLQLAHRLLGELVSRELVELTGDGYALIDDIAWILAKEAIDELDRASMIVDVLLEPFAASEVFASDQELANLIAELRETPLM